MSKKYSKVIKNKSTSQSLTQKIKSFFVSPNKKSELLDNTTTENTLNETLQASIVKSGKKSHTRKKVAFMTEKEFNHMQELSNRSNPKPHTGGFVLTSDMPRDDRRKTSMTLVEKANQAYQEQQAYNELVRRANAVDEVDTSSLITSDMTREEKKAVLYSIRDEARNRSKSKK